MAELNKKIREEDATVTSNLTDDIILELLSCLPVKSLLRFRCVCKSSCGLIDHPDFVKMHLHRSIATSNNLSIVSVDLDDGNYNAVKITSVELDDCEQRGKTAIGVEFDYPIMSLYGSYVVISCNGLIYMFLDDDDCCDTTIPTYIFNPSTRTHKEVPVADFPRDTIDAYQTGCGFGYDPTTDDYMVIRVLMICVDNDEHNGFCVMVYSLSSNSWRRIEDIPLFHIKYFVGVFTNSAFHWVLQHNAIVAVDIKDDELRELPLPDLGEDDFCMTIGVLGETHQLCMLCNYSEVRIDFWVMKDYGVRHSWEKQFVIEEPLVLDYLKSYLYAIQEMVKFYSRQVNVSLSIQEIWCFMIPIKEGQVILGIVRRWRQYALRISYHLIRKM